MVQFEMFLKCLDEVLTKNKAVCFIFGFYCHSAKTIESNPLDISSQIAAPSILNRSVIESSAIM